MESLPNNSEKALSEKKPIQTRKVERIEGAAAQHRPTFWKMLKSSFIPENMTFLDVVADMIMPAIRDGVFDIISGSVDYWRSGVGGYSNYDRGRRFDRSASSRNQGTRYDRVSRMDRKYDDDRARSSGKSSYDDIFIPDGRDRNGRFVSGARRAEEVIAMCNDDIRDYNVCRVSDFLEHCGLSPSPNGSDYNWGWTNLDRAMPKPVKGGAVIFMPDALQIED